MKNILFSFWNETTGKIKKWVDFDKRSYDISPLCKIPESTQFIHKKIGVVIGSGVKLGENIKIYQNVTIGSRYKNDFPTIKDNVIIFAYSYILGNITIGKNSIIGAYSLVIKDIPKNSIIYGIPAKIIKKQ